MMVVKLSIFRMENDLSIDWIHQGGNDADRSQEWNYALTVPELDEVVPFFFNILLMLILSVTYIFITRLYVTVYIREWYQQHD